MKLFISVLLGLSAGAPARTHDIQAEDYFSLSYLSQLAVRPDGAQLAWVESRWQGPDKRRNPELWVVGVKDKRARRLTFNPGYDGAPRWSADGQRLYFLSVRPRAGVEGSKKRQIYSLPAAGGPAVPVTEEPLGVDAFELTADGRALVYLRSKDQPKDDALKALRGEHKGLSYGSSPRRVSQFVRVDLGSWRSAPIGQADRYVASFALSPKGDRLVAITVPSARLIDMEGWSKVELLDLSTGRYQALDDTRWRAQAPSPYGWLTSPGWSPDGSKVSFRIDFDGYPGETVVVGLKGGAPSWTRFLPRLDESTPSGPARWRPGHEELCVRVIRQARDHVDCSQLNRQGHAFRTRRLTRDPRASVEDFRFDGRGRRLAIIAGGLDHAGDLFTLPATGASRYLRLTHQNPQMDTWRLPSVQTVRWMSPDGTAVEGILELPPGHPPGERLPLLVELHGGPTSATRAKLRFWIYGRTLYAARGWAVLSPNYRGSTGYGDKFLTDLIGHKNDRDVADILSGVDAMVARGIADPERMAIMGWSNGGYLVNCLIGRTDRFKAASSGAGVLDTAMQWMLEDTPGHVVNFAQGLPWKARAAMAASAPLYQLGQAKTPTLIHVGERDARVPAAHARALFRALDQYLKVPTELVVYPGEGHGLTQRKHRAAKMAWDEAWLKRYVLDPKPTPQPTAEPAAEPARPTP